MDLEIYNKAKICKYLEFYKKNLSKEEYKKVLKQFKLSLKLGNFSFAKTLLQRRGFIFVNTLGVTTIVNYDKDTEVYTVVFSPMDVNIDFYVTKALQLDYFSTDRFKFCTSGHRMTLGVCDITPTLSVTILKGKITGIVSEIIIKSYIYECCNGSWNYYGNKTVEEGEGYGSYEFFAPVYDENNTIIKGESVKVFNKLCKDNGVNCVGCQDCVYFLSSQNLHFIGEDQCYGEPDVNDNNYDSGSIEYDSSTNNLKVSFPTMQVWAGGGGDDSGKFQYEYTSVEVKV